MGLQKLVVFEAARSRSYAELLIILFGRIYFYRTAASVRGKFGGVNLRSSTVDSADGARTACPRVLDATIATRGQAVRAP